MKDLTLTHYLHREVGKRGREGEGELRKLVINLVVR